MIHEIGVELGVQLAAVNCPLKVLDGPENTKTVTYARERIVIEHDPTGDKFSNNKSQQKNPKIRVIRNIGVKITIYAQEASGGAMDWEHRRRAEHVLDLVLVALEKVLVARHNGWTLSGGRFIDPNDLATSEVQGGSVYELTFSVERGVYVQTWTGNARPEMTILPTTIQTTTDIVIESSVADST